MGGGGIFIDSCFARLITFEMNLKTTDFKAEHEYMNIYHIVRQNIYIVRQNTNI